MPPIVYYCGSQLGFPDWNFYFKKLITTKPSNSFQAHGAPCNDHPNITYRLWESSASGHGCLPPGTVPCCGVTDFQEPQMNCQHVGWSPQRQQELDEGRKQEGITRGNMTEQPAAVYRWLRHSPWIPKCTSKVGMLTVPAPSFPDSGVPVSPKTEKGLTTWQLLLWTTSQPCLPP